MPNPKVLDDMNERCTNKTLTPSSQMRLDTLVELAEDVDNLDGDG